MHIFISRCPLTYSTVFEHFDFEGENFEKEKKNVENFGNFIKFSNIFKIRDISFVAPLILRHFI